MNCVEFRELMDDYLDSVSQSDKWVMQIDKYEQEASTLTDGKKKEFEEHMEACSTCKAEFIAYQKMINSIHTLKPEKLPEGYCKRLNEKLKVAKVEVARKKRINYTKYIGIAAAFVLVFVVGMFALNNIGMNLNKSENIAMDKSTGDAAPAPSAPNYGMAAVEDAKAMDDVYYTQDYYNKDEANEKELLLASKVAIQEKIIKTGSLNIETLEFDKFVESLNQEIKNNNGYIENSEIIIRYKTETRSYRYANFNLRVPQEVFDNIIIFIEEESEVSRKNISENDVTKSYYDKQNILTNLEIQENRLRELYSKAENITDILALENEIRRIRTEIDSYSIDLRNIDDRVSMSTIQLSVTEIEGNEISIKAEDGLWTRAKKGFIRTVNNILDMIQSIVIWIISYSIIIIPLIAVGILTYKRIKKNKKS